jgi:ATP-binding cassette, subfamily B, bacterial HlyB/CyaB
MAETKRLKTPKPALDTGLIAFVTVARILGIPADPEQIRHALALGNDPMSELDILRAAKEMKLKAKAATVTLSELKKLPLPLVAQSIKQDYFVVAQFQDEKILILKPGKQAPETITLKAFEKLWNGRILLFTKRIWQQDSRPFGLRWFIPTIIKYKKPLIQVLIAAFFLQVLGLFTPILTQVIIDKALVHQSLSTLDVIAIGMIIVAVFEAVMTLARTYIFTHTTSRIDVTLSARLFNHLFSLPLRYFETRRVGDTAARVQALESIRTFLTGAPLTTVIDVLFMGVYIVVMFIYSVPLTWVVLGSLPFFAALAATITPMLRKRTDEKFNTGAESQSFLVESVTGAQTIKSFALEPTMQKRWEDQAANYTRASYRASILSGNAGAIGQLIQKLADLAILWFGAQFVINGDLTIGGLIAFRMLSGRVSGPVLRLVQSWQDFQQASISIKRLGDIFNSKPEPRLDPTKSRLPAIKGDIRFEKVRFRYTPDTPEVIRDMSFGVRPGAIIGVVGRSGSGKSTLSKLMQRLYVPEGGKILIDGVDTSLTDPAWLRQQIGVVLQENFLFNGSIRDNIAIHKPAASMEEVVQCAQVAGAHEFILALPNGYDTMIGEQGEGLSGGQKQRVAIARALIHNPKILIFDEATSALDYESESIIQKNLKRIAEGRTMIIIAHRLSTLKDAHLILAIDKGQVVEYGPPKALLEKKGLYYHLHSQQQAEAL